MTTKNILITAVCAFAGLSILQAENTATAVTTAKQEIVYQKLAHPFFQDTPYPAWSQMNPQQGIADTRAALALARQRIEEICLIKPEEATFENTFLALNLASDELGQAQGYMYHLSSVMDNEELREAQESLIPELSEFDAAIIANDRLWSVIKSAAAQPWVKELSPAKQRFVQQTVDSFVDSGADLPADKKARKAAIEQELSQLTLQFAKNVLDSTNAWKLLITDKEQLHGMSDDWMAKAQEEARARGFGSDEKPAWLITLDYTSVGAVLRDCDVEQTRKMCWHGQATIGAVGEWDNEPVVARVMELRRELAELLGFKTYADLTTHRRMVGGGDNAMAFIDNMAAKVLPAFREECSQILDYVSKCKGENVMFLDPWDRRYYLNKMSQEMYQFDPEELRPYHRADNVVNGMFALYGELLGVSFAELPTICLQPGESCPKGHVEVWHPEVKLFKVTDNKTGAHLGSFYMDLFPRASKRAGAWVMPMRYGAAGKDGAPHAPHLATLVGNLSTPTEDKPALFSHYDVETIFHEFGHMMHCMLGDTELQAHCGTSVTWDFVELPSQMFENWTWYPEGIARYAFHYETGEPMPAELIAKLQKSRYFLPATDNMGQLCYGKLDLEMHMNYDEKFKGKRLDVATAQLLDSWRLPMSMQAPSFMRHLTHCINGGYSAGYYSYKWAEVLSADAFTRFRKEGLLNTATGADFREAVLSKGDSKSAAEVYRDFMGRDPNPDALLESQGLIRTDD
ncbi:MAG: M3 family metallopeptidase [Akkermansia sp.]|nr:M3 family metallopeptidase [Akkermansia sp.]